MRALFYHALDEKTHGLRSFNRASFFSDPASSCTCVSVFHRSVMNAVHKPVVFIKGRRAKHNDLSAVLCCSERQICSNYPVTPGAHRILKPPSHWHWPTHSSETNPLRVKGWTFSPKWTQTHSTSQSVVPNMLLLLHNTKSWHFKAWTWSTSLMCQFQSKRSVLDQNKTLCWQSKSRLDCCCFSHYSSVFTDQTLKLTKHTLLRAQSVFKTFHTDTQLTNSLSSKQSYLTGQIHTNTGPNETLVIFQ